MENKKTGSGKASIKKRGKESGSKKQALKKQVNYQADNSLTPGEAQETYIAYWLGMPGQKTVRTGFDLISISEEGITKDSIDQLTGHLGITKKSMAEEILGISIKTMERKSSKDKLDKKSSSHAVEIARVMQHAFKIFRDETKLKRWLNTENRALNQQKPVSFFSTLTGLVMVNDVLGRIEEGVYS